MLLYEYGIYINSNLDERVERNTRIYLEILPFHGVADYDNECENTSTKKKLLSIMDNDEFQAYLQENKFVELLYILLTIKFYM